MHQLLSTSISIVIYAIKGPFELNLLLLKLKTENWKYCNKIIFKCVNGIWDSFLIFFSAWTVINSTGKVLVVPWNMR